MGRSQGLLLAPSLFLANAMTLASNARRQTGRVVYVGVAIAAGMRNGERCLCRNALTFLGASCAAFSRSFARRMDVFVFAAFLLAFDAGGVTNLGECRQMRRIRCSETHEPVANSVHLIYFFCAGGERGIADGK